MLECYCLPEPQFIFGHGRHHNKFKGIQKFGPYRQCKDAPRIGFVFPDEYRDLANKLFLFLKNGIGYFRGVQSTFKFRLEKDQIVRLPSFTLENCTSDQEINARYCQSLQQFFANPEPIDLLLVIHSKTEAWDEENVYFQTKELILKHGYLSQDVTVELLEDQKRLEWSVANIALAMFAKLDGIPWLLEEEPERQDLVLGVGIAFSHDPITKQGEKSVGYTACYTANGRFMFTSIGEPAAFHRDQKEAHLLSIEKLVQSSIAQCHAEARSPSSITLHVSKKVSRDEADAIQRGLLGANVPTYTVKISDESKVFAVSNNHSTGVPLRGTAIGMRPGEFILYTEGREDTFEWRFREPSAIRVESLTHGLTQSEISMLVKHAYHLSQINWRGFNARARTISLHYGQKIAQIIQHFEDPTMLQGIEDIQRRLWFL